MTFDEWYGKQLREKFSDFAGVKPSAFIACWNAAIDAADEQLLSADKVGHGRVLR